MIDHPDQLALPLEHPTAPPPGKGAADAIATDGDGPHGARIVPFPLYGNAALLEEWARLYVDAQPDNPLGAEALWAGGMNDALRSFEAVATDPADASRALRIYANRFASEVRRRAGSDAIDAPPPSAA